MMNGGQFMKTAGQFVVKRLTVTEKQGRFTENGPRS